jgi:hypothetical protein
MSNHDYQHRQARAHARARNPQGSEYVDWLIHIVDTYSRKGRYPDLPEGFDARFEPNKAAIEKAYQALIGDDLSLD